MFPSALPEVCDLLEAPTLPPVTVLARTLVNELDAIEEPFVLVLDDVHRIRERAVLDLLTELMEHPPRHLHLVLIGRRDPFLPIARLRARNQLAEVRSEDLSFTVEETETFLENVLGTDVSAAVAGTWRERTEGWATGLRLAALALRGGAEVPERPFAERKPVRDVTSYLMGEVLERQPPAVRDHLLRSSAAARFCAPLCDALAGAEGPDAEDAEPMDGAAFVEWVEQAGLFVIPLDAEHGWSPLSPPVPGPAGRGGEAAAGRRGDRGPAQPGQRVVRSRGPGHRVHRARPGRRGRRLGRRYRRAKQTTRT